MTTNYRYHRHRVREIPVTQYECSNCGVCFQYFHFAQRRHKSGLNFCSNACKTEYFYLAHQMSKSQLNILELLLAQGGSGRIPRNTSVYSLSQKIAPLITVSNIDKWGVDATITARGLYWYNLKRNHN